MFIIDEIVPPKYLDNINYNLELKNKFKILLKYENILPFNIYGSIGNGKKTYVKCFLNSYLKNIYPNDNIISKIKQFTLSNNHTIIYIDNIYYYELYPNNYNQDNSILLNEFLNFICNSMIKIILVIYNIDKFSNYYLFIKKIIEKYNYITIITTSKNPINLLINFRNKNLSFNELYNIGSSINIKLKLKYSIEQLKYIADKSKNLYNLFILLQKPDFDNYYNIDNITTLILKNDITLFPEIRKILKKIITKQIFNIEYIFKNIICNIYYHTKNLDISNLISIASDIELESLGHKYTHTYIEIFIINIYNILNSKHVKII